VDRTKRIGIHFLCPAISTVLVGLILRKLDNTKKENEIAKMQEKQNCKVRVAKTIRLRVAVQEFNNIELSEKILLK